jgi:hypothetical protein
LRRRRRGERSGRRRARRRWRGRRWARPRHALQGRWRWRRRRWWLGPRRRRRIGVSRPTVGAIATIRTRRSLGAGTAVLADAVVDEGANVLADLRRGPWGWQQWRRRRRWRRWRRQRRGRRWRRGRRSRTALAAVTAIGGRDPKVRGICPFVASDDVSSRAVTFEHVLDARAAEAVHPSESVDARGRSGGRSEQEGI